VLAQTNQQFQWLIRFDRNTLPAQLQRVQGVASNIKVIFDSFHQHIALDTDLIATTRLDNDDAIHVDFVDYVQGRNDGTQKVVDVKGYQLDIRNGKHDIYVGKYIETHRFPTPFITLMTPAVADFPLVLSHFHDKMGEHYPVDSCDLMYFLQIVHGENASNKIVGKKTTGKFDWDQFGLGEIAVSKVPGAM
jgi:hypothetical protein